MKEHVVRFTFSGAIHTANTAELQAALQAIDRATEYLGGELNCEVESSVRVGGPGRGGQAEDDADTAEREDAESRPKRKRKAQEAEA